MTTRGQINSNFYQIVDVDSDGNPTQVKPEFVPASGDANYANFAGTAFDVSVGNVSGIGNIATVDLNGNVQQVLAGDGTWIEQTGGGGNVGGANTQVQFNDNGVFAGSPNLTFDITSNTLTATKIAGNGAGLTNLTAANITGIVGNATHANVSDTANSVAVANVTGIGNIATVNLDGNVSNILHGDGSWSADITSYGNSNVANYLPTYSGVIGNVTTNNLVANTTQLSNTVTPITANVGQMFWDTGEHTVTLGMENGVQQQIGLEQYILVKASSAITNGQVVMFTGADGNNVTAAPANASSVGFKTEYIIGIATQDIALNGFGYITTFGSVHGLNTNAYTVGDILWYDPTSTTGGLTATQPVDPNYQVQMAAVTKKAGGDGHIQVRITVFNPLTRLSDVQITTPTTGQALVYNGSNVWVNGNVGFANVASKVETTNDTTGANVQYVPFVASAGSNTAGQTVKTDEAFAYLPVVNTLIVQFANTTLVGNSDGVNATSNVHVTGSTGNVEINIAGTERIRVHNTGANVTGILGVSGNINSSGNITASRLISNVATGTAPFTVASTTQVANLNAATAGTANTAESANTANHATTANSAVLATNSDYIYSNISTDTLVYPMFVNTNATGYLRTYRNTGITANLANSSITATTFVGNVTGNASSATTAVTVTGSSQPNITSTGALTGLTVSNATGVVNFTTTANVSLGSVSNLHITGGTSGQFLTTNGSGTLSWANTTVSAAGSNSQVQYNSNGAFAASNTFTFTSGANSILGMGRSAFTGTDPVTATITLTSSTNDIANVSQAVIRKASSLLTGNPLQFTDTHGFQFDAPYFDVDTTDSVNLGNVSNLHIQGGIANQFLQTDGAGNLTWAEGGGGGGTPGGNDNDIQFNIGGSFDGTDNFQYFPVDQTGNTPPTMQLGNAQIGIGNSAWNGANLFLISQNGNTAIVQHKAAGLTITNQSAIASKINLVADTITLGSNSNVNITGGTSGDILSTDGAGNLTWVTSSGGTPAGSNTYVQFNDDGSFGADAAFTFDSVTGTLAATNFVGDGSGLTSVHADTSDTAATVTDNAQPNITSTGTLTELTVDGLTVLGPIGNINISGGTSGQVLSTDGAGNLSWTTAGGGSSTTDFTPSFLLGGM